MAKTNITPMTGMYNALKNAHNQGLSKAITKEFAAGAGADVTVFDAWVYQIEQVLYPVVRSYVQMKIEKRYNPEIKSKDLEKARKEILPVWKIISLAGQDFDGTARIHISKEDVEELVGFAKKFVYRPTGVAETGMGTNQFRRLVESMLGCMMAKSHWCTEKDADIVKEYDRAVATCDNGEARINELKEQLKKHDERVKRPDTSQDLKKFLMEEFVNPIKAEIKDIQKRMEEAEITCLNLAKDVRAIEEKAYKQIP